jgi:hypothetical protein
MAFDNLQIESLQGVMKRTYHYFVDETCYVAYIKKKQKDKQKIEVENGGQESPYNECEYKNETNKSITNTKNRTKMNEQNLQNGNCADGADNNASGHKITFLELFLNVVAFAIVASFGEGSYQWWIFIVGAVISAILAWYFDAEKYDKATLGVTFVIVFLISAVIFGDIIKLPAWAWLLVWPVIYAIMVLILSKIKAVQTTCDNCKKEYAMEVYDTVFLRSENISIEKKQKITDVYGKEHFNSYYVPGIRRYYRNHRRCKYCGYEDTVKFSEEEELVS